MPRKDVTHLTLTGEQPTKGKKTPEETILAYAKKASELKNRGYTYKEIAEQLAKEFNFERVPNILTVTSWLSKAKHIFYEQIRGSQEQLRIDNFQTLENLKNRWIELAMDKELAVERDRVVDGVQQKVIDENAFKEQNAALQTIVKIIDQQAKLLGLHLEKPETKDGKIPDLQTLQLWLINQLNVTYSQTKTIPSGIPTPSGIVLELKSGIAEIDEQQP